MNVDLANVVKRCTVCGRFRSYAAEDGYCVVCGHESLSPQCDCGRAYDYLRPEDESAAHCPRCGRALRGRQRDYEE